MSKLKKRNSTLWKRRHVECNLTFFFCAVVIFRGWIFFICTHAWPFSINNKLKAKDAALKIQSEKTFIWAAGSHAANPSAGSGREWQGVGGEVGHW